MNYLSFYSGFLTDVCVYQTSMAAARLLPEMSTFVVEDCCAAKTENDHNTALEKITSNSVKVISRSDAEALLKKQGRKVVGADSDEWLMIDKLFSAAGVAEQNDISVGKLRSLISSMPSRSPLMQILSEKCLEDENGDKTISREDLHSILFERKPRTGFLDQLTVFIIIAYMPFFYSISTRIPFIFVALELTVERGRALWEVGIVLGVYQTSRALGNLFIVMFGGKYPFQRLQILMILSGIFGWSFLSLWERPTEVSTLFAFERLSSGDEDGDVRPLFALFGVGFCETVVILQRTLMIETANESPSGNMDKSVLSKRFTLQYSLVALGATIAFLLGGWLYTEYGFYAVCDFGILVQFAHLFGALLYLALTKKSKRSFKSDELDGNDLVRSCIYQFQAFTVISKYSRDVANGTEYLLRSENSGLSMAAITSKSDRVLNHSLNEMYHTFFSHERNDIDSMEELLKSIDEARTEESLITRRPLAMSISKNKLSKLLLFHMKSKGDFLTEGEFRSFWAPRVYLSMFESSQETSVTVTWPYMKAVVATQAIAALCIGVFLSTSLLSYTKRFEMNAAQVGTYLGIGEGLGVSIMLGRALLFTGHRMKTSDPFSSLPSRILAASISRPLNVPMILIFASSVSMLFSIDNLVIAVICQLCFSAVNDLSVSYMNELTGTSLPPEEFKYYQGIGQWLRRLGNMITAILGPIFFDIHPSFPFVFFGKFSNNTMKFDSNVLTVHFFAITYNRNDCFCMGIHPLVFDV